MVLGPFFQLTSRFRLAVLVLLLVAIALTGHLWGPYLDGDAHAAWPSVQVEQMPPVSVSSLPIGQTYNSDTLLNVTSADNNVIKTSAGTLTRISINSVTTSGTITVYDGATCAGTKIATITAPFVGMSLPYGGAFTTGLCINTGSSTDMDLTVTYR